MALSETQINSLIENNVWNQDCPVHHSKLTVLEVPYINFDGFDQIGEIMISERLTEQVASIFKELYQASFPIHSIELIDHFKGNDVLSMESNNSSAFNGRRVMNTDRWSSHAYGVAIDINPVQNPYMVMDLDDSSIKVYPSDGMSFVNRGVSKKGMVETIIPIFAKYGFTEWGGSWELKPDYHHFQIPWEKIEEMFPDAK